MSSLSLRGLSKAYGPVWPCAAWTSTWRGYAAAAWSGSTWQVQVRLESAPSRPRNPFGTGSEVKTGGDRAIRELSNRFDCFDRESYRLTKAEIDACVSALTRASGRTWTSRRTRSAVSRRPRGRRCWTWRSKPGREWCSGTATSRSKTWDATVRDGTIVMNRVRSNMDAHETLIRRTVAALALKAGHSMQRS